MPHSVSVCGFIGHAFINKTKFCIILDQFFLAGQHKTFSALLSCILDCTLDQLSCISVFTIIRKCIDTEYHLPCTILVVHSSLLIHFICQICLIGYKTIYKCDQFVFPNIIQK